MVAPDCDALALTCWGAPGAPEACTRPITPAYGLVNHTPPSGPGVMPYEPLIPGSPKCEIVPAGVMRPMTDDWLEYDVYQSAPSGPAAITNASGNPGSLNLVVTPPTVMRPIELSGDVPFVNHS